MMSKTCYKKARKASYAAKALRSLDLADVGPLRKDLKDVNASPKSRKLKEVS